MTLNFDQFIFRKAQEKDLEVVLQMLFDDILGKNRENIENIEIYKQAFLEISKNKNDFLAVVELDNKIIATCHLTLMLSLTRSAAKRMNIEAVRVNSDFRGKRIGEWMIKKAIEYAKENDVRIIQLTTDKNRADAKRFYESIGFVASHEGMKLAL